MTAREEAEKALAEYERTAHLWDFEPQVVRDLVAALRALLSVPETENWEWKCGNCGGNPHEHSLSSSTCLWNPVPVEEDNR